MLYRQHQCTGIEYRTVSLRSKLGNKKGEQAPQVTYQQSTSAVNGTITTVVFQLTSKEPV